MDWTPDSTAGMILLISIMIGFLSIMLSDNKDFGVPQGFGCGFFIAGLLSALFIWGINHIRIV